MKLILASGSPRRRELLQKLYSEFEVLASDIDEVFNHRLPGVGEQVSDLALQKARAVAESLQDQASETLILGADTIVYHQGRMLGKPADAAEATAILTSLSHQQHEVITGLALIRTGPQPAATQGFAVSRVTMREINPDEISAYIATGEPMDKAGAYAIQGGAAPFVTGIEGSYENIVGLPLELARELLEAQGLELLSP